MTEQTYTRPNGEPYDEQSVADIEEYRERLETGRAFALSAASHRSVFGYQPPMRRQQWSHITATIARMAAESDALAQIAKQIVGRINLYGTPSEAAAKVYEAAFEALNAGYDNVILRAGPEAPRFSDCQRDYTLKERIRVAIWLNAATTPVSGGAPGIGWCLDALARAHGIYPDHIMRHAA